MEQPSILSIVLRVLAVLLIALVIFYKILPPQDINLKDITPPITQHTSPKDSALRGTIPIDSTVTDGEDIERIDYYIIVESIRNLTQAQQKAEKLINDFNSDFILLPPTKEGFNRISCGRYFTLEEAKSKIKSIRTNIRSDAWILSVKKNNYFN